MPVHRRLAAGVPLILLLVATGFSPPAVRAGQLAPTVASANDAPIAPAADSNSRAQCLSDLKSANVEFVELGRISKEECTVEGAVQLNAITSPFGNVSLPGKPIIACAFARQFTRWVREVAAPLTLAYMNSKLAAIETGQAFECRTRYNTVGEKLSEHAKGNAIDVTGFRLESGLNLLVKDSSASTQLDGSLMRAYRATGCGYFTTILGPGSNEAHKEHLHFDYGLHGDTYNYRICE
jgi:hypothetical protein